MKAKTYWEQTEEWFAKRTDEALLRHLGIDPDKDDEVTQAILFRKALGIVPPKKGDAQG